MKNLIITIVVIILIILGVIWFTADNNGEEVMEENTEETQIDGDFTTMPAEDEASQDVSEMEAEADAGVEIEVGL